MVGLIGTPLAFDLVSRTIIDLIRQCIIFWRHFTASWWSSYETLLRSSLIKSASWASRYVTICRYMKPFNSYLHRLRLSQGLTNLHAQKESRLHDLSDHSAVDYVPHSNEPTSNQDCSILWKFLTTVRWNLYQLGCKPDWNWNVSLSSLYVWITFSARLVGFWHSIYMLNCDSSHQHSMEFISTFMCHYALHQDRDFSRWSFNPGR
jgi:hypothetical protein